MARQVQPIRPDGPSGAQEVGCEKITLGVDVRGDTVRQVPLDPRVETCGADIDLQPTGCLHWQPPETGVMALTKTFGRNGSFKAEILWPAIPEDRGDRSRVIGPVQSCRHGRPRQRPDRGPFRHLQRSRCHDVQQSRVIRGEEDDADRFLGGADDAFGAGRQYAILQGLFD